MQKVLDELDGLEDEELMEALQESDRPSRKRSFLVRFTTSSVFTFGLIFGSSITASLILTEATLWLRIPLLCLGLVSCVFMLMAAFKKGIFREVN